MLGANKLQAIYGAVPPGANTFDTSILTSIVTGYADQGMSVLFIGPDKAPMDLRTQSQTHDDEQLALNLGQQPKAGWNLATKDKMRLKSYVKQARKNDTEDPEQHAGYTPINIGIVPNRSACIVVDCDTSLEMQAFKNFFMDHTTNPDIKFNMDNIRPSVISPGSVKGGQWVKAEDEQIIDDYGAKVYVPPRFENVGGVTSHAGGGHWYFFYPEWFDLPENFTTTKIQISYDAVARDDILAKRRDIMREGYRLQDSGQDTTVAAQMLRGVDASLDSITAAALYNYRNKVRTPSQATFTIMIQNCYVLAPPSSRFEGHYKVGSGDFPWEDWVSEVVVQGETLASVKAVEMIDNQDMSASFADMITAGRELLPATQPGAGSVAKVQVTDEQRGELNDVISQWASVTPWANILLPLGWEFTGKDQCGCDIFKAPGYHDSPKSATAHDVGCSAGSGGLLPELGLLHFWTDNPPEEFVDDLLAGKRNFSKMTVYGKCNFGGDMRAAIEDVGLRLPLLTGGGVPDGFEEFYREMMAKFSQQ